METTVLNPAIEPYEHGLLEIGDDDLVYWETCGSPRGKLAVVLHGGPGSGCVPGTAGCSIQTLIASCCSINGTVCGAHHVRVPQIRTSGSTTSNT